MDYVYVSLAYTRNYFAILLFRDSTVEWKSSQSTFDNFTLILKIFSFSLKLVKKAENRTKKRSQYNLITLTIVTKSNIVTLV